MIHLLNRVSEIHDVKSDRSVAKEKLKLDNLPSVEQAAAARNVLLVLQLDPEFEHYFKPYHILLSSLLGGSSYLKWTIQGLFSCWSCSASGDSGSMETCSHLIPWPHSQSPMGIGVVTSGDAVVDCSGGGKVPLPPTSLESWQVRHFSLVSTQFPFPSSFGFSTITLLLQPRTVLGRRRMARRERRGKPCIAKGPLATAGDVSPCNPDGFQSWQLLFPENAFTSHF